MGLRICLIVILKSDFNVFNIWNFLSFKVLKMLETFSRITLQHTFRAYLKIFIIQILEMLKKVF